MSTPVRHRFCCFLAVLLLVGSVGSPLWAQAGTARAGLGVFGPVLGIHGGDTLVVNGTIVLNRATVVGIGTLSLRSHKPQNIIAHQSRVQNLHLATAEAITLHGELIIEKSLTIDGTALDAREATLTLGDSARLWLRRGGQLKREMSLLTARPEHTKAPVPTENPLALPPTDLPNKLLLSFLKHEVRFGSILLIWRSRPMDEPSPPPET